MMLSIRFTSASTPSPSSRQYKGLACHSVHCAAPAVEAQLTVAKDHAVVFGHIHLQPTSHAEHTKFWIQTLGGAHFDEGGRDACDVEVTVRAGGSTC